MTQGEGSRRAMAKSLAWSLQQTYCVARAAAMIAAATSAGFDNIATWLASTFTTVAPISCAIALCKAGGIMRSFSVNTHHDGLLCHAASDTLSSVQPANQGP